LTRYTGANGNFKNKDSLLTVDRSQVMTGEIYELQECLENAWVDIVSTFLVDLKREVVDEDLPYGPLETLWYFDADLAARHKFPATTNPLLSASTVLEGAHTNQTHFTSQQLAKKILRRYYELSSLVNVRGIEKLPESEKPIYQQGERLEDYLTQVFYLAENFTGMKGGSIRLQETLADVSKIFDMDR